MEMVQQPQQQQCRLVVVVVVPVSLVDWFAQEVAWEELEEEEQVQQQQLLLLLAEHLLRTMKLCVSKCVVVHGHNRSHLLQKLVLAVVMQTPSVILTWLIVWAFIQNLQLPIWVACTRLY